MEILKGEVIHGENIGGRQGYPTANLSRDSLRGKNIEKGVYVANAFLDEEKYKAISIIGVPGIKIQKEGKVEIYLLNYRGNLYGKEIKIELIKKIRSLIFFEDKKKLLERIEEDIKIVEDYFISVK